MAEVCITWTIDEEHALAVSVEVEGEHPDVLDEISRRAVYLFNEALAVVHEPDSGDSAD